MKCNTRWSHGWARNSTVIAREETLHLLDYQSRKLIIRERKRERERETLRRMWFTRHHRYLDANLVVDSIMSRVVLMTANHYVARSGREGGNARFNYVSTTQLRSRAALDCNDYFRPISRVPIDHIFQTASRIFDIFTDRRLFPFTRQYFLWFYCKLFPIIYLRDYLWRLYFSLFIDEIFFSLKNETNKWSQMNVFRCLFRTIYNYSLRNLPFCFVVLILGTRYILIIMFSNLVNFYEGIISPLLWSCCIVGV